MYGVYNKMSRLAADDAAAVSSPERTPGAWSRADCAAPTHRCIRMRCVIFVVSCRRMSCTRDSSNSPARHSFAATVVCIKGRDGARRLCLYYWTLNSPTVRNTHPLPKVSTEMLVRLHCAGASSNGLGLRSGQRKALRTPQSPTCLSSPIRLHAPARILG